MKKLTLLPACILMILLFSCQKEKIDNSLQKVELSFYTYKNSSTPVKISWTTNRQNSVEKYFTSSCSEKFTIKADDTLSLKLTPDSANSYLNIYFKLIINDVTVRSAKLYNDTPTNTECVELVYYARNLQHYTMRFAHDTDDWNEASPFQLIHSLNDSVYSSLLKYTVEGKLGDLVSSKIIFTIPSNPPKPLFHKTIILVNEELVRYDYIKRTTCGNHSSEMRLKMVPCL